MVLVMKATSSADSSRPRRRRSSSFFRSNSDIFDVASLTSTSTAQKKNLELSSLNINGTEKKYRDRKLPCFGSAAGPLLFFRHCCVTDVCVEFNHQRSFSIRDSSLVGALADEWCREISLVAAEKARTLATSKTFVVVGKRRRCCCDD